MGVGVMLPNNIPTCRSEFVPKICSGTTKILNTNIFDLKSFCLSEMYFLPKVFFVPISFWIPDFFAQNLLETIFSSPKMFYRKFNTTSILNVAA